MLIKIIVLIFLMGTSIAGDGIFIGIYYLIFGEIPVVDYSQPGTAFCCVMVLSIELILYVLSALVWNKMYKKQKVSENTGVILLEDGSQEKAKQLLTELTERISATSETPYCSIPVINAVLTEKAMVCGEQGILLLPELLPVDDFDLCIILGNLVDNAIRACSGINETWEPGAEPEIRLSAGVVQGYLVIKCKNPVFPETEEKKGTGYGQKILKSLAEKHQGNFLAERQEGQYRAQISLLLEKEQSAKLG